MTRVRTVFAAAALVATVLPAASCIASSGQTAGTPSEPASPTPTPSQTSTVYTLEAAEAAMPTKATLKKQYDNVTRTDPTTVALFCGDIGITAPDGTSGTTVSAQSPRKAGGWNVFTSVVLSGLVFPSSQAADGFVARARTAAKKCAGKIDQEPVKLEDGYRPGERGRGTLADVSDDGWEGFRLVAVTRWSFPKDETGPSIVHGNVIVVDGNAVFAVAAVRPDDKPKAVTRTLDRWAEHVTREMG